MLESDHTIVVVRVTAHLRPRIVWCEPSALWARNPKPASATFLESCRGHPVYITGRPDYAGASVMRAADDPAEQFSPQLGVRTPEIESREEHRVKRKPTAEEGTQD